MKSAFPLIPFKPLKWFVLVLHNVIAEYYVETWSNFTFMKTV